ncbi:hypothetical protein APTSU1_000913300 [Apodemus speciosus]|uniref:Uncharacterized protein n=1 Tax=Apodemus speciosus TaxID=105296 RepID=A0ABQ0F478_APOSI
MLANGQNNLSKSLEEETVALSLVKTSVLTASCRKTNLPISAASCDKSCYLGWDAYEEHSIGPE